MSYFGGRRDPKQAARDAIVGLRQQLQMIDKKEEYLQKKIEEETKKAQHNAVSNKPGSLSLACLLIAEMLILLLVILTRAVLVYSGHGCPETKENARKGP